MPPGQNNLHELWALLNFLLPAVFQDSDAFSKVFDLNVDDAAKKQNMIKQLHKILRCVRTPFPDFAGDASLLCDAGVASGWCGSDSSWEASGGAEGRVSGVYCRRDLAISWRLVHDRGIVRKWFFRRIYLYFQMQSFEYSFIFLFGIYLCCVLVVLDAEYQGGYNETRDKS